MSDALAIAQCAPGEDAAANLAAIERLATTATQRGAGLVVLPEYASYFSADTERMLHHAQSLEGEFVRALAALADRLGIHLVAGTIERADDGRAHNTLVAVAPGEGLIATYRKQHLYDAFGGRESDWLAPGDTDAPQTFGWRGLTVGMQTCYDIRFPEVTRRLVDAGADLVLCPAEWVRGPLKEHHWRTLVTARAIENTVWLAVADHAPPVGVGTSLVVDPMGVAVAEIGEVTEDIALAWPTRERVDAVRAINPALALRRYRVEPGTPTSPHPASRESGPEGRAAR